MLSFIPQLFVRPPHTTILPSFISFPLVWFWSLPPIHWTSIHSSSGTLSVLIPWIYSSSPLYNPKRFDLGHIPQWPSDFPYFLQFKSEFYNKELMIWAIVSSRFCFYWLCRASPTLTARNIITLSSVNLKNGLFFFWLFSCKIYFCYLNFKPLYDLQIVLHILLVVFSLFLILSFDAQKFFILMKSNLLLSFVSYALGVILKNCDKFKVMKMFSYVFLWEFYSFSS